jgi:hypothetical protein
MSWLSHPRVSAIYYDDIATEPSICIDKATEALGLDFSVKGITAKLLNKKETISEYNKGIVITLNHQAQIG